MSDIDPAQHVTQQIEASLLGGLSDEEQTAFDAHVAACAACAAALREAVEADARLEGVFAASRPGVGLEDRIIDKLRVARSPRWRPNPVVRRVAVAAAAAIVVGGAGVVVNQAIEGKGRGTLYTSAARISVGSSLKQLGAAIAMYGDADGDGIADVKDRLADRRPAGPPHTGDGQNVLSADGHVDWSSTPFSGAYREHRTDGGFTNSIPSGSRGLSSSLSHPALLDHGAPALPPPENSGKDAAAHKERTESAKAPEAAYYRVGGLETGAPLTKDLTPFFAIPSQNGTRDFTSSEGTVAVAGGDHAAPVPAPPPQSPLRPAGEEEHRTLVSGRKVIRNGQLDFEVDSFDSALVQVTKIVGEEGGFVSTTDSDKLPNGHVRGTVVLRVAPEHLDTLVLKLRGIGDLKTQKITAQDITKQYTDLQSELRAAKAMEERLLDIIKNGHGAVKDLLEAEKQLGVWREKIEQVEGEIRYDDNLVSLSTLAVTLVEKDIRTPAYASETEQITMALETPDVEAAYAKAADAIAAAKGRVITSELKQYDAGQFGATLTAQLPPDAADAVVGRVKQSGGGRVAHFERQRSQSMAGGAPATLDPLKVSREDVTLKLTMYNLANVAPRHTTSLSLAAGDVEGAYQKVLAEVAAAGGRVVSAALNRGATAEQTSGAVQFQVPAEKADAALAAVRRYGEVLSLQATENPDKENTTDAKRGFTLNFQSLAAVPARQTVTLVLAAASVPEAFEQILHAAGEGNGHIVSSQLNQQDRDNVTGSLVFEVGRDARPAVDAAVAKHAAVISRRIDRSADVANTVESKVRFQLTLVSADRLRPRQVTTLSIETPDVERAADDLAAASVSAGGREVDRQVSQDQPGQMLAHIVVEVPLAQAAALADQVERAGNRRLKQVAQNEDVPDGSVARARLDVTFANSAATLGGQEGTWDAIRHGLAVSGAGLRWSLTMIVIGLCFLAPWAILIWGAWRLLRRRRPVPVATP